MCDCYCEEKKGLKKSQLVFFMYSIGSPTSWNELRQALKNNFHSFQTMWEQYLKNIPDETLKAATEYFFMNEKRFPELDDFLKKCAEISKKPILISETPQVFIDIYKQNNCKFIRGDK